MIQNQINNTIGWAEQNQTSAPKASRTVVSETTCSRKLHTAAFQTIYFPASYLCPSVRDEQLSGLRDWVPIQAHPQMPPLVEAIPEVADFLPHPEHWMLRQAARGRLLQQNCVAHRYSQQSDEYHTSNTYVGLFDIEEVPLAELTCPFAIWLYDHNGK